MHITFSYIFNIEFASGLHISEDGQVVQHFLPSLILIDY